MTHPPLDPTEERQRAFFHYRKGVVVEVLTMSDALALWRIEHWHQDLWPCEWGLKTRKPIRNNENTPTRI